MLDEPTLLNKGAKPFKFVKKEKNLDEENVENKTIIEPCCNFRTAFSSISFDYDLF